MDGMSGMKTAVILAAGDGTKIWPYAEVRPKVMIPIAGKPIIAHQVDLLKGLGFKRIVIAAGRMHEQIKNYFCLPYSAEQPEIEVVVVSSSSARGTAFSLNAAAEAIDDDRFLVLYGDTLLEARDMARLAERLDDGDAEVAALVAPLGDESPSDWICSRVSDGEVKQIAGHPRERYSHRFSAFACRRSFLSYTAVNAGLFTQVEVGAMPPLEGHLEMSVADYMAEGGKVPAVETEGSFIDIDKPWHILQASEMVVNKLCGELTGHVLAEGASIDPSASVNGFVKLGKGSRIGRNVVIEGNIIVGDGTVIENGAILQGIHVIGNETYIGNYCYLSAGSTVGNRCVINHCAELDGIVWDTVYLYHYMEFYGIIGMCTDLGAATVCGTLRFDDGQTSHRVKGRRENPREHANAVYLGDFVRTGVNAILMPGVKVGVYSVVGPGVLLSEDVPNRTILSMKQELVKREWGPERYGW